MCKHSIAKYIFATSLSLVTAVSAMAQHTVKGTVVNALTGQSFTGASISVAGTKKSTMSDDEGRFELSDIPALSMLQVKAPDCEWQIVALQGRSDLVIRVTPRSSAPEMYDEQMLSASVKASAAPLTGATTSASETLTTLLQGAAYSTTASGIDASAQTTFIRGIHSINATSQPLYIVDGVIWQSQEGFGSLHEGYTFNPLALIDPDDIERIEVLKNGTALYGAKGANGVVMISTRRSHNMATEITVNLSAGFKSPFKTLPMMNASQYKAYATDVMRGMDDVDQLSQQWNFLNDDSNSSNYLASHNTTDWLSEINKSALTQNYGVSVRGGDDVALYSFSLGYVNNAGNIDNTNFERLGVRFNSDISLTRRLTARADISFSQVSRNIFNDGINDYNSPLYLAYIKSPLYHPYLYDTNGQLYSSLSDTDELGVGNPLAIIENGEGKTKNYRFVSSLQPSYQFSDRFSLSAIAALSWDKIKESSFTPDYGVRSVELYNEQGQWYGTGSNQVASFMTRHSTLTLGGDAKWQALLGSHSLHLLGGMRYYNDTFESDYGMGYNTGSDNLRALEVTNSSLRTIGGDDDSWRTISWYAQAQYDFLKRYYLTASATMETNSRFGSHADGALRMCGVSWGLFPSVEAAWLVTGEQWMRSFSAIDYLRLHVGYEIAGNDDLPVGATRTYFTSQTVAGLARGLVLSNVGNDRLTWETTATANIGFDLRMLNNRLSLGADFYTGTTKNLLVQKNLPEEYGLNYYWANDGKVSNKGFDLRIGGRLVQNRQWQISADALVGHSINKVKALAGDSFTTTTMGAQVLTAVGQSLGTFYGYEALGVISNASEAASAPAVVADNGSLIRPEVGDVLFADLDNDGKLTSADQKILGNSTPDVYGNMSLRVQYKGFSLGTVFTYAIGQEAYNALRAQLESGNSMYNQTSYMTTRWTADGDNTVMPRASYGDVLGNARFSNRWIEDASYLKLRQISLSYTLPKVPSWLQGLGLWASVNNVFTISKYLGADPEFSYGTTALTQGIDCGLTPSTRSYHIGVKINL